MRILSYTGALICLAMIASYAAIRCELSGKVKEIEPVVEKKMNSENPFGGGVKINAEAHIHDNVLTVNYTVVNSGNADIVLFDQMVGYDGNVPVVSPKTAYAFFDDPSTLRLVRGTIRLPLEKEVRVLETPFARRVEKNSEAKGTIEMPLPVSEKSPFYAPPKDEASKLVDCNRINLIVGWSEIKNGMSIIPADSAGPGALRIRGAWSKPYQHFLEAEIVAAVKVKVHTDVFDRQMPLQ